MNPITMPNGAKVYQDLEQGSQEWEDVRALNFTASDCDAYCYDPLVIDMTVDDIRRELDAKGILRKGLTSKADLLEILPDKESRLSLSKGARTAIARKINQERTLILRKRDPATLSAEEMIFLEREDELKAKEERQMDWNIPVKYGKLLEPYAVAAYQKHMGFRVEKVGFIEHPFGGFGCSPDGIIIGKDGIAMHGLECKAVNATKHLNYLLSEEFPDEFIDQCEQGMAVTGLDRWDLILYCPGYSPAIFTRTRSADTDKLESGLKTLVTEKKHMRSKLGQIWARFNNIEKP